MTEQQVEAYTEETDPLSDGFRFYRVMDEQWPAGVTLPVSVEVNLDRWDLTNAHVPSGFFPDRELDYGDGPMATLTMENGASLVIEYIDPTQSNEPKETLSGNWGYYSNGEEEVILGVHDTLSEILAQAVQDAERGEMLDLRLSKGARKKLALDIAEASGYPAKSHKEEYLVRKFARITEAAIRSLHESSDIQKALLREHDFDNEGDASGW